jgi:hypothetical protein
VWFNLNGIYSLRFVAFLLAAAFFCSTRFSNASSSCPCSLKSVKIYIRGEDNAID